MFTIDGSTNQSNPSDYQKAILVILQRKSFSQHIFTIIAEKLKNSDRNKIRELSFYILTNKDFCLQFDRRYRSLTLKLIQLNKN